MKSCYMLQHGQSLIISWKRCLKGTSQKEKECGSSADKQRRIYRSYHLISTVSLHQCSKDPQTRMDLPQLNCTCVKWLRWWEESPGSRKTPIVHWEWSDQAGMLVKPRYPSSCRGWGRSAKFRASVGCTSEFQKT